jgi:hypothetical protein
MPTLKVQSQKALIPMSRSCMYGFNNFIYFILTVNQKKKSRAGRILILSPGQEIILITYVTHANQPKKSTLQVFDTKITL